MSNLVLRGLDRGGSRRGLERSSWNNKVWFNKNNRFSTGLWALFLISLRDDRYTSCQGKIAAILSVKIYQKCHQHHRHQSNFYLHCWAFNFREFEHSWLKLIRGYLRSFSQHNISYTDYTMIHGFDCGHNRGRIWPEYCC